MHHYDKSIVLYVPKLAANQFSSQVVAMKEKVVQFQFWTYMYTLMDQRLSRESCSARSSYWQHVSSGPQSRKTRTSVRCRMIK